MKKKGSTLITVVAVFAILFTIGTAILSLSLSSFKLRKVESKKIENLYGSESGIDASKKIIQVAVQTAIKKANLDVIRVNSDINTQIENLKALTNTNYDNYINDIVRTQRHDSQINYLLWKNNELGGNVTTNTLHYVDANGKIDLEAINTKLKTVFHKSYMEFLSNNLSQCFVTNEDGTHSYNYVLLDSNNNAIQSNFNLTSNSVVNLNYTPLNSEQINDLTVRSLALTLNSIFTTTDGVKREIEANYVVNVPDLSNKNISNNSLLQKSIAADGNMYVKGNVTVNGDVFVKGNQQQNNNNGVVYTKYDGGININIDPSERNGVIDLAMNDIDVKFNGNVVTPNTFNIKQHSTVTIDGGNLYANNVNLGKVKSTDTHISNNVLNVRNDMIVDNDFTYNADSSTVNLNNLYAINELTSDGTNNRPEKSSSSIIINRNLGTTSSITINRDAYIIGSAYIRAGSNDNDGYQTGESIAVKGNYLAYTSPINDNHTYKYEYFKPLQLVNYKDNSTEKMSMQEKATYFIAAANRNEIQSQSAIALNGNLDNFYINGAFINKGEVEAPVLPASGDGKVEKLQSKRMEYANQVYEMGDFKNTDYATNDPNQASNPLIYKYSQMTVDKTVSNLIDISSYDDNTPIHNDNNTVVAVYNQTNGSLPILLSDNENTNTNYSHVLNINGKKGIIITNGNIVFDSKNINFSGTIISTKDISFLSSGGNSRITINYDGQAVQKLINKYNLQAIFNNVHSNNSQVTDIIGATEEIDYSSAITSNYWKIIK